MNLALWLFQVLLAAQFLFHGWLFVSPPPNLAGALEAQFPVWFRLSLGVAELLAAVGLILPGVTRIMPRLIPLAALGLMVVTLSASVYHVSRGELSSGAMTLVLFIIATFVAYMRWRVKPVSARQAA